LVFLGRSNRREEEFWEVEGHKKKLTPKKKNVGGGGNKKAGRPITEQRRIIWCWERAQKKMKTEAQKE